MHKFCFGGLLAAGVLFGFAAAPLFETYKEPADRIIAAATADNEGYAKLAYLCDRIGNRLAGSASLQKAIEWSAAQMKKDGLENVVTPPVKVPHWVRGRESAEMTAPLKRKLTMLGLGDSVGTPAAGITGEVVPVSNFDQLAALGREKVAGKIVLFDVPWEGYGKTVAWRGRRWARRRRRGS